MTRFIRRFTWSLAAGLLAGLIFGALGVASNDYLAQGLARLALHVLADAAWTYLAAGAIGGAIATVIHVAGGVLFRRRGGAAATLTGLFAFLAAAAPIWAWSLQHDFGMYPRDRGMLKAALAAIALLHLPMYFACRWFARGRRGSAHDTDARPSTANTPGVPPGGTTDAPDTAGAPAVAEPPGARRPAPGRMGRAALAMAAPVAIAALLVLADRLAIAAGGGRPNVLIIVMDTVRRDRMSCYGYDKPTTPEIDAFARESIRFTDFHSTSSWTVPSHASLFTGLYPARHRATQENATLGYGFATLAEVLRDAGYRTWGASGNAAVGWVTNMMQGFDEFVETFRESARWYYRDEKLHVNNAAFRQFLASAGRERPFFAFVNYIDAHNPYLPPEEFRRRFVDPTEPAATLDRIGRKDWTLHFIERPFSERELSLQSQLYDAEVAYVSRQVGALLQLLRDDGRYDDTLILVTSDHGELFGEHGLVQHVFGLYTTAVHVPLIMRLPGGPRAGEVSPAEGQFVDVLPTVLTSCGVAAPRARHQGRDLMGHDLLGRDRLARDLPADASPPRDGILSEYYFPAQVLRCFTREQLDAHAARLAPYLRRLRALQRDGRRLIWSSDGRHEYYDLTKDPAETVNLYDAKSPSEEFQRDLAHLEMLVRKYAEGVPFDPVPSIHDVLPNFADTADPEAREMLKNLGYLQ